MLEVHLGESIVTVQAEVGMQLVVHLESTPGAGAIWRVQDESKGVAIETRDPDLHTLAPGSLVIQPFILTVESPGEYVVEFVYGRPWETIVRDRRQLRLCVAPVVED
jgi:predicted secreted protein